MLGKYYTNFEDSWIFLNDWLLLKFWSMKNLILLREVFKLLNASSICLKICDFFFLEIIVPHSHHRSFFFILSNYKLHVLTSVLNRYKSRFDYYFLILELKTSIGGGGGNASCVMRVGFVRNANLYRCRFCLFFRRDISNNDVAQNPCNTKENFQSERNIHFFNLHLIIGLPSNLLVATRWA